MKTPVTSAVSVESKTQIADVIASGFRKKLGPKLDELEGRGVIHAGNFQRVHAQGDALVEHLLETAIAKIVEFAELIVGHLKLISGAEKITIGATKGKSTIARASQVFTWIDGDFKNYGTDVRGKPTVATSVQVFEMIEDGTFAQIFGGFGENLDRLCLSQDQIVSFCRDQAKWLRDDGYGTFFLFKVKGQYFVADVFRHEGRLGVYASRLSHGNVWFAGRRLRVVVPQL